MNKNIELLKVTTGEIYICPYCEKKLISNKNYSSHLKNCPKFTKEVSDGQLSIYDLEKNAEDEKLFKEIDKIYGFE